LDLALQLQPETKEIVCIAGTASFDQLLAEECRKVLEGYGGKVQYRFIGAGPIDETLSLIRNLPTLTLTIHGIQRDWSSAKVGFKESAKSAM
jgi:hypothetical protein